MRAALGLALVLSFATLERAEAQVPGAQAAPDAPALPPILPDCRKERAAGEIVVCGDRDERSRFELPVLNDRFDPDGEMESVSRERHELYEVGDTGIHSCSTVGPGGYTGCDFIRWKADREQDADKNVYRGERPRQKERGVSIGVGPVRAKPFGD